MLRLIITLVGLLVVTAACFGQTVDDARTSAVIESVYRYQIAQCYKDRSPEEYFVSYERHDPDEGLLTRLSSSGQRVMKQSQWRHPRNPGTGRWSVIVSVVRVHFQSQRVAYVKGACETSALDSYSYSYRVEFRWGRWIVMRRKLLGFA
jgi:hypothetical protein